MDQFDKNLYVFVLGRLPELSIAELKSCLSVNDSVVLQSSAAAIIAFSRVLPSPQKTLNMLGGIIKINKVFGSSEARPQDLAPDIIHRILEKCSSYSSKINYGISIYNLHGQDEKLLKILLKNVKRGLSENNRSSRFVNKDFKNVHNVVVAESDLINKGIEILLCGNGDKIYLAETVAIQDFKSYENRDYNRPKRDINSGMLPPKIAQIMINLTGLRKLSETGAQKIIYDPFCGSGTILTEAILMEFGIIGSDKSEKAILDTAQNIKWILDQYKISGAYSRIFKKDINELTEKDIPENIDAIVSELYLGPRLTKALTANELDKIQPELEILYANTLKKFKELDFVCPIILAIAAFKTDKNSYAYIENFPQIAQNLGFKISELSNSPRKSLIYDRPDQFVAREIFCLWR